MRLNSRHVSSRSCISTFSTSYFVGFFLQRQFRRLVKTLLVLVLPVGAHGVFRDLVRKTTDLNSGAKSPLLINSCILAAASEAS